MCCIEFESRIQIVRINRLDVSINISNITVVFIAVCLIRIATVIVIIIFITIVIANIQSFQDKRQTIQRLQSS